MVQSNKLFKNNPKDKIWWVDNGDEAKGEWVFTFDKVTYFNMFEEYPDRLTPEQKRIFDEENPFWADYFKDRE